VRFFITTEGTEGTEIHHKEDEEDGEFSLLKQFFFPEDFTAPSDPSVVNL
jgi:hypothetical protein